ncbi:hypothetical protein NECAME_12035 [Necator americanus]|uniref:Uncharacterized protein n=2 Tax=Necator americanus TaxID=51031 RepID=W2T3Y0_NECAM|nr:hypothetical protein NECAME_12035 [Necator americanus]ETN75936.1 hypothetical protein NECAME_12035 [Necator americanus]
MVIELSTILLSAVFYVLVAITLYRTRKRFLARSNSRAEVKILIQAFVITAYCTVLNFLWHNSQVTPFRLTFTVTNIPNNIFIVGEELFLRYVSDLLTLSTKFFL